MTVKIVKTKESDGDWIKVLYDNSCAACLSIREGRSEAQAMERANEIAEFIAANNGREQVIKTIEA